MNYEDWLNEFKRRYKHTVLINKTDHYIIRCPYCGDSYKHPNKGHLYIAKQMPVFYCVRCDTGGHIAKLLPAIRDRFNATDYEILRTQLKTLATYTDLASEQYSIQVHEYALDKTRDQIKLAEISIKDKIRQLRVQPLLNDTEQYRHWYSIIQRYKQYNQILIENWFQQLITGEQKTNTSKTIDTNTLDYLANVFDILHTDILLQILETEKQKLLAYQILTESDLQKIKKLISKFSPYTEAVYIGQNGIQLRLTQNVKGLRFVSYKFAKHKNQRLMAFYMYDKTTVTKGLLRSLLSVKYPSDKESKIEPYTFVIAESVSDLIAFAYNLYNKTKNTHYIKPSVDPYRTVYAPAFGKGLYMVLKHILARLDKNKYPVIEALYVLVDKDAIDIELDIIVKLLQNGLKQKVGSIHILVPIDGKDYRQATEFNVIEV